MMLILVLIQPLKNSHLGRNVRICQGRFFLAKKLRWFIAEASVLGVDSASSSWGILEMWKDDAFVG